MQAAGSVDDHYVLVAVDTGIDGVERDGRRIRAGVATDEIRTRALGPAAKLVDRPRTESVCRSNQRRHPVALEQVGEFPDEGGLPRTVDADDEDHRWCRPGLNDSWVAVSGSQRSLDRRSQRAEKLILRLDQTAPRLRLYLSDETHGCGDAKVRLEENFFELLERALDRTSMRDRCNVGEGNVFYSGPKRTGGEIAGAPDNPAWHFG